MNFIRVLCSNRISLTKKVVDRFFTAHAVNSNCVYSLAGLCLFCDNYSLLYKYKINKKLIMVKNLNKVR